MEHYLRLLESIASARDQAIADDALLSPEEKRRIVVDWNAGDTAFDADCSIVALFRRQAERTPDKAALVFEGGSISYRELDRESSQLAHNLLGHGLDEAGLVGVCMERGLEAIAVMLSSEVHTSELQSLMR